MTTTEPTRYIKFHPAFWGVVYRGLEPNKAYPAKHTTAGWCVEHGNELIFFNDSLRMELAFWCDEPKAEPKCPLLPPAKRVAEPEALVTIKFRKHSDGLIRPEVAEAEGLDRGDAARVILLLERISRDIKAIRRVAQLGAMTNEAAVSAVLDR